MAHMEHLKNLMCFTHSTVMPHGKDNQRIYSFRAQPVAGEPCDTLY